MALNPFSSKEKVHFPDFSPGMFGRKTPDVSSSEGGVVYYSK